MKHFIPTAFATVLVATLGVATAQAASPSTVDLQVEGSNGAVIATTSVTTTTAVVNKDGNPSHNCTGTSAAGAIERATNGDWTGPWYNGLGYSVERVLTETQSFSDGRYFAIYVNGRQAQTGACDIELQDGDDLLFYAACAGASTGCYDGEPLFATAPRTPAPGTPFTVTVREATSGGGSTVLTPSQGASVAGRTTDADGKASVTLTERGAQHVVVTKGNRPPERVPVCVTDGADGFCGTTKPVAAPAPGGPTPAPAPAAKTDERPRAKLRTIAEGQTFERGEVPRLLRGNVPSTGAGVDDIRLRLTRNDGGRCFRYDDERERQARLSKCGARGGKWFSVGDRADWQYQLAFTLPRGRWVLDIQVRDRAGRYSRLERGNTRVVFTVR